MKVFLIICGSILWMISAIDNVEDYCKIPCGGRQHIACKNKGDFDAKCGEGAELVINTDELKEEFMEIHNQLRNEIASGQMKDYDSAARMASMTWDDELAQLAALSVKTCDMRRDKCRNTKKYKNAGQNVGTWAGIPDIRPVSAISYVFQLWYDESTTTPMSVINKFTRNAVRKGLFALLVNERNFKIGCAILSNHQWGMLAHIIACNYPHNNVIGETIYKRGKPASECKSGTHPTYPSLCNTSEKYDV